MYPPAPRSDIIDTLHGVAVPDPFRPLENADDPATIAWVDAENALTRRVLDGPHRDALVERLRQLHRYPRASVAAVRGPRVFFLENDGTRNQPVLYVAGGWGPGAGRETLVDPNLIDADGTTAITAFEPDEDGARVVYALSRGGSDLQELAIRDVASNSDLPDRVRWVKFASIAWAGNGFFYTRFPEPGTVGPEDEQYFCQVWHHRLADAQSADTLVYDRPDAPEVVFDIDVTSDGRHLVITSRRGSSDNAEVHIVRLPLDASRGGDATTDRTVRALVTGFTAGWHFIDGAAGRLYFLTDADAPLGRIVRLDLDEPVPEIRVIIAESQDKIESASIVSGHLVVSSLHNASSRLLRVELDGRAPRDIALPGISTIVGIGGRWHDPLCLVTLTSFTTPPQILACDLDACRVGKVDRSHLPIDPASYITEQVWYPSKDGTPISMFLVSRHDRDDGRSAGSVLLSGYGGFNISMTPSFDASDFLWLDAGGVIAVANLRGGGEYGETWHRAGMLEKKQNVFDDFIAAGEWLRSSGRARRLAVEGGSNGGLLVAAATVQRPDLLDAVVCRVPVADMLRYHRFTVGRFWIPEYGSADDASQFPFLLRYSPYHNVGGGVAYPPVLVMTADTDDRVAPGMAKKFAARLQEAASPNGGPILLRVETRAGHGAGKPVTKQIQEQADLYAFLNAFLFQDTTPTSVSEQQRL
jgi:prolyl oligopeptidase